MIDNIPLLGTVNLNTNCEITHNNLIITLFLLIRLHNYFRHLKILIYLVISSIIRCNAMYTSYKSSYRNINKAYIQVKYLIKLNYGFSSSFVKV